MGSGYALNLRDRFDNNNNCNNNNNNDNNDGNTNKGMPSKLIINTNIVCCTLNNY